MIHLGNHKNLRFRGASRNKERYKRHGNKYDTQICTLPFFLIYPLATLVHGSTETA